MNELETAARPLLTPLIMGTSCTITESSAPIIARWIALKILVGEHNLKGVAVATKEQRENFRSTLMIPDGFRIWIGRCGVDGWRTAYWRHVETVSLSPDVKPKHRFKNTHSVTFGIGELLVHVFHTNAKGLNPIFDYDRMGLMASLLPFGGSIDWPSTKSLSGIEATFIARGLEDLFRGDNAHWKPLPD